jgi:hypothetical protein
MKTNQTHARQLASLAALAAALLAGCAARPTVEVPAPPATVAAYDEPAVRVDESSMLPLLGYQQLLAQLSPQELARERAVLLYLPPTPSSQLRLAMLFGQTRATADLPRAQALLDKVLRANDPAAASMHPLARLLATQYHERLRLQAQNERLLLQVTESQRRSSELQDKLDALANIERSLPLRPTGGEAAPGTAR